MGRREGRFPGAPGGSRREGRERVSTSSSLSSSPTPGLEAARGVERGLRAFRSIAGEAGTEKDESEFHGFSEDEISVASSRAESLRKEGDTIKHTLAQARGEFFSTAYRSHGGIKKKKANSIEAKRRSIERRYSAETKLPQKSSNPKKRKDVMAPLIPEITVMEIPKNLQQLPKPKADIRVPSWRPVEYHLTVSNRHGCEIKGHQLEEDMSDSAFERRHEKAEEEEQELWEKWTAMRQEEGKAEGGRSKSSQWREVALTLTPRLRSQRITSTASSTPGRLSPTTMARVQEIYIAPIILPQTPISMTLKTATPTPKKPRLSVEPWNEMRNRMEQELNLPIMTAESEPNLRRVRNEIRRSSNSSSQQQRPSKENVGEEDEQRRSRRQERHISSSTSTSRVLKDSNVASVKAQLSRQSMMKRLGSPPRHFQKDYPLRSQSLSRRTRRGSRR